MRRNRNFQIGSCVSRTGRNSVTVVFCIEAIVIIAPELADSTALLPAQMKIQSA
jgi:hypothetical protein